MKTAQVKPTMFRRALAAAQLAQVRGGDEILTTPETEEELAVSGYIRVKKLNS